MCGNSERNQNTTLLAHVRRRFTRPEAPSSKPNSIKCTLTCFRCGRKGHTVSTCKTSKDVVCHRCHKRGHLQRACKSGQSGGKGQAKSVSRLEESVEGELGGDDHNLSTAALYHLSSHVNTHTPLFLVSLKLYKELVKMEVDTGAMLSLMAECTFHQIWPERSGKPQTYLKEPIPVVGCIYVNIEYMPRLIP